jgi:tRNA-dihydrouridine synthase B
VLANSAFGLSIAELELPNRAFLAPMAGITDRPFRMLAARFGAGLVVSEMIASASLATGQHEMVRKLSRSGTLPHVVQLAGCEARWMEQGARIAADAGAQLIDINFGCPSKRVTNGYAGSALMRVPDLALRLIEAVAGAGEIPVTVKMRLGWDDDSLNAPQIARLAVGAGARMITVHARTRQQFYKDHARWALVRSVVEAVDVPVVVNGDIIDLATAREALVQSGAAAVMIGRGAQGQPWRVGQIGAALAGRAPTPAPEGQALVELVVEHFDAMLDDYGRELGVRVARKHLGWYLDAAGLGEVPLRKGLMTEDNPDRVRGLLTEILESSERLAA